MVQVPNSTGPSGGAMRGSPATSVSNSTATSTRGKPTINGNGYHPVPAPTFLSSMHSVPLDEASVERRGQPTASREPIKKNRLYDLEEAPTYRPTEEEFRDPFEFIKKISGEASQYGICKIIPPSSWKPSFAINTEKFHFRTRKQELNSVEGSTRANLTYLDQLSKFHKQNGLSLTRFPSVDKRPLDLYKLKKAVETRGGFEKVCKLKKWAEIGRDLGYSGKIMSSLSTSLKNSYQRWLFPYEEYLRWAKPGVHAQIEFEYGAPLTPSPANSPMKKSHQNTPSSLRGESPAIRAHDALNASIARSSSEFSSIPVLDSPRPVAPTPPPVQHQPPVAASGGFTPVNAGGFTPVNSGGFTPVQHSPASFTPVLNHAQRRERERDSESSFTPTRKAESPISSAKNTPEYRPSALSAAPLTANNIFAPAPNPLKRQLSHDSVDSRKENSTVDDGENSGRRSKRLKKDTVPNVAGSHMTLFRPSTPRIPGDHGSSTPGEKCEHCGKGTDLGNLLSCESCDHGYHMYCLDPQVTIKPEHDWHCPRCLVGDGQFGFEEGGTYSLKQFQDKAADFKEGYFENRLPYDSVLNCRRPVTEDDIEKEFWRLVSSLEETVEVEYGADIHSTTHGSGFPTTEKNPKDPFATDPWNLNILPLHADSLFRHIKSDISGMTVPWLYVGMIFSTFCWHNEDHYAYSANYQHFGSTKTWYGIPAEDATKFETAMRNAVPELFETQPDLLFQLVTLLTPEQLKKEGVRVYALDQRAGQFVITFPQAYHAGFNHGFNFNEAVNFAPADWEPFGESGVERLQEFRRQPCFSHDELLWTAAEGHATGGVTIQTAKWLAPALNRMREREYRLRKLFMGMHKQQDHPCVITEVVEGAGPRCHITFSIDDADVPEEEYQCVQCKMFTYLSRFKCTKSGKVMCLEHAGVTDCCELPAEQRFLGNDHSLIYRKTEDVIDSIYQKVADKASLPEQWEEKVERTLEEGATPSLKVLRSLLNEAQRIPYDLPSLPTLKAFVKRCDEWVAEATNIVLRKTQDRRKEKRTAPLKRAPYKPPPAKFESVLKLQQEADDIGFDCIEITQLEERITAIKEFQAEAQAALENTHVRSTTEILELCDLGRSYNIEVPEIKKLEMVLAQKQWNDRAVEARAERSQHGSLSYVKQLIRNAEEAGIPDYNDHLRHFREQRDAGEVWERKAKELMSVEAVHYPQLEALSNQAQIVGLPVTEDTLFAVDQILNKQREAHKQIISLLERSKDPDIVKRPKYKEVGEAMKSLSELNSKPSGTLDLEKEQKRHEDWMRKGKKLFGKANAPLHILKTHMEYVLERNQDCFDVLSDKPRTPAEPASLDASPSADDGKLHSWEDPRFREVFCICRKVEAGMMIECELCHEWYHGKCLKIARGKVKEDEKYTCPICDWRVKIPRDAARPKLEDLHQWQDEIAGLPFQPDEEELLEQIIDNAEAFRQHVSPFVDPLMATSEEADIQRFYLRKIEGAEVLLTFETNFLREQLHKWAPVAPEAPPQLEHSKSTRKPRPTKLQKLMAQHGVDNPEALPPTLRTKQHNFKRKESEPTNSRPPPLQPAPGRSDSGTPTNNHYGPGPGRANMHHNPLMSDHHNIHPSFTMDDHPYGSIGVAAAGSNPTLSSAFGGPSPRYSTSSPPRAGSSMDPGIFTKAALKHPDLSLGAIDSPMRDNFPGRETLREREMRERDRKMREQSEITAPSALGIDSMFEELTNQDEDGGEMGAAAGMGERAEVKIERGSIYPAYASDGEDESFPYYGTDELD